MTFVLMKCQPLKEIICADAMYQSTAHARGNCATGLCIYLADLNLQHTPRH